MSLQQQTSGVQVLRVVSLFLQRLAGAEVDAAIVDYVAGVLEEHDAEHFVLEDLDSLLEGVSEDYAAMSQDDRLPLLLDLVHEVRGSKGAPPHGLPALAHPANPPHLHVPTAPAAAFARSACRDGGATGNDGSAFGGGAAAGSASASRTPSARSSDECSASDQIVDKGAVRQLASLCPGSVRGDFLAWVLHSKFANDLEAAAEWVLDAGEEGLEGQQAAWLGEAEQRLQRQQEEAQALQRSRRQVLSRFDLQEVREVPPHSKRAGHKQPDLTAPLFKSAEDKKTRAVRYRDGQVVSCKGEKFIVERIGEEWDGGSKGKVYTKGKRGKGYV